MNQTIEELNERHSVDGVRFETGAGGLVQICVSTGEPEVKLFAHGAHVSHFQVGNEPPLLWMSDSSRFEDGKAIRGGVPLVFPWFGPRQDDPEAPSHGLVRTVEWSVSSVDRLDGGDVRITFEISVDRFDVVYRVTVGRALGLEMTVTNRSDSEASFEQAFHTYLTVGDVRQIRVRGLQGSTYIDKVDEQQRKVQAEETITFTGETDSVYLDTESTVIVEDPVLDRDIVVRKQGSRSTVVWNPWIAKSKRMADFGDNEWPGMVCIETANVADNAVHLKPGDTVTMNVEIGND